MVHTLPTQLGEMQLLRLQGNWKQSHTQFVSPQKKAHYLHKERNAEGDGEKKHHETQLTMVQYNTTSDCFQNNLSSQICCAKWDSGTLQTYLKPIVSVCLSLENVEFWVGEGGGEREIVASMNWHAFVVWDTRQKWFCIYTKLSTLELVNIGF